MLLCHLHFQKMQSAITTFDILSSIMKTLWSSIIEYQSVFENSTNHNIIQFNKKTFEKFAFTNFGLKFKKLAKSTQKLKKETTQTIFPLKQLFH